MSEQKSRREILRKTAYVVPTVLTLAVKPSLASSGSGRCDNQDELEKHGKEWEDHGNSQHEREAKEPKKTARSTERSGHVVLAAAENVDVDLSSGPSWRQR